MFAVNVESVSVGTNLLDLRSPVFCDTLHGLIFSYQNNRLLKTDDGGKSWSLTFDASALGGIFEIKYPNKDTAFFTITDNTNHRALCYRSTNACASWTQIFTLYENRHLSYYNGKVGYAVSAIPPSISPVLLKTTNSGTSWATFSGGNVPGPNCSYLQFFNSTIGFARANGFQYRTIDGGYSWTSLGRYQVGTRFSTNGQSYRVNDSDQGIDRTDDFGTTWTQVWEQTNHNIDNLAFSDGGLVVAVNTGYLMISSDFGLNWKYPVDQDGVDFSKYSFGEFTVLNDHTIIGIGGPYGSGESTILRITF